MSTVTGKIALTPYHTALQTVPDADHPTPHIFFADEPEANGGGDAAPSPGQMLLGSLAACKLITMRMYASRKEWPVESIDIKLTMEKDTSISPAKTQIHTEIEIHGALDAEQKARLTAIAAKCPVHKILTGEITID